MSPRDDARDPGRRPGGRSDPDGSGHGSSGRLLARHQLGAEGEQRAAAWLEARGWRVVARNVRADRVEIDLVARRGRTVAFVEVKTRRSHGAGLPEEAVDARKRARLVRGATAWLAAHGRRGLRPRLDVIACEWSPERGWTLRHLENAFDAGE